MSQEWLNIQSFFADHKLIGAINDLSIHLKQEMAGVRDRERAARAEEARSLLREFLGRLQRVEAADPQGVVLGMDARFQSLTDALATARREPDRFHSTFVREGAPSALTLLESDTESSRPALLESLAEMRRIIEVHQQADTSAIFEEV
jgi:hypothetical protein